MEEARKSRGPDGRMTGSMGALTEEANGKMAETENGDGESRNQRKFY